MAAEDDDFTFCQVGPPVEDYGAQKVADDFGEIHVDDRNANAANTSSNSIAGSIWNGLFSRKQETVGSLSVNVIDASSRKEVNQPPKPSGQEAGRQPKPAEQEVSQQPKKAEQEDAGGIWNSLFPRKQETVGSLSFNVINASSGKEVYRQTKPTEQELGRRPKPAEQEVDQQSKKAEPEAAGSSNKATPEIKAPVRKPKPRAKVPYEKGYSQMDWLKLTRTHPDLADLKGQTNKRLIKMSEVKQHQSEDSMWTVLKGRVYNITPYMKFHPGGVDKLMKAVGKDCTFLFNKYHAWVNAEFMLEKCLVGIFDDSK